jgi:hypothetical protein
LGGGGIFDTYFLPGFLEIGVGGDVELRGDGEEGSFVFHVADDVWDVGGFSFAQEVVGRVEGEGAVGARVPAWEMDVGVGNEVWELLDGVVEKIVGCCF